MKYQNFNRSCTYAAIANLLQDFSIDTEDYSIVKSINIPYILNYDSKESKFIAGPMLQDKKWFNYYLNPLGLEFEDKEIGVDEAINYFDATQHRFIVGLNIGNMGKHTVIYEGKVENKYKFLNNKRSNTPELEYYFFDQQELIQKLDHSFLVGWIRGSNNTTVVSSRDELCNSLKCINQYKRTVKNFCSTEQNIASLREAKSKLFEAFFLDIYSMMDLIGEKQLVKEIGEIRNNYIKAMTIESDSLTLSKHLNMDDFLNSIDKFQAVVEKFYADNF